MRMITLNKITAAHNRDFYNDNEEGESQERVTTTPVTINVEAIRCFYPRRDAKPGTRITFTDGGGFAVAESCDAINEQLA